MGRTLPRKRTVAVALIGQEGLPRPMRSCAVQTGLPLEAVWLFHVLGQRVPGEFAERLSLSLRALARPCL